MSAGINVNGALAPALPQRERPGRLAGEPQAKGWDTAWQREMERLQAGAWFPGALGPSAALAIGVDAQAGTTQRSVEPSAALRPAMFTPLHGQATTPLESIGSERPIARPLQGEEGRRSADSGGLELTPVEREPAVPEGRALAPADNAPAAVPVQSECQIVDPTLLDRTPLALRDVDRAPAERSGTLTPEAIGAPVQRVDDEWRVASHSDRSEPPAAKGESGWKVPDAVSGESAPMASAKDSIAGVPGVSVQSDRAGVSSTGPVPDTAPPELTPRAREGLQALDAPRVTSPSTAPVFGMPPDSGLAPAPASSLAAGPVPKPAPTPAPARSTRPDAGQPAVASQMPTTGVTVLGNSGAAPSASAAEQTAASAPAPAVSNIYAPSAARAAPLPPAQAMTFSPIPSAMPAAAGTTPLAEDGGAAPSRAAGRLPSLAAVERTLSSALGGTPGPRLHLGWDGEAVSVWIGVDGAADPALMLRTVQQVLRQQGLQLSALVCNGRTIVQARATARHEPNSTQQEE